MDLVDLALQKMRCERLSVLVSPDVVNVSIIVHNIIPNLSTHGYFGSYFLTHCGYVQSGMSSNF